MKTRAITSVLIILSIVPLILFSHYFVYPLILAALCVTAVCEILKVIGVLKNFVVTIPAFVFAAAFPMIPFFTNHELAKNIAILKGFIQSGLPISSKLSSNRSIYRRLSFLQ